VSDREACVDFLQRLIRIPGLPGEEGDTARLVEAEMLDLGYADVRIDEAGNVLGRVPGGDAPALMFNTHLDHVDVGDHDRWPHPPYSGEIHDGSVWGRGAVDIKGPMSAQVHGVARLLRSGRRPAGDVWVTAVVQEEIGGVGARWLQERLSTPAVIVGEPSSNTLRRGHRGRCELIVHVVGRSIHASVPAEGINPWYSLARFLDGLDALDLPEHPELGRSSVSPTLIRSDQSSANVVPGELWLTCDWRLVPGETAEDARAMLQRLLDRSLVGGATGRVDVPVYRRTAWTGLTMDLHGDNPAYILAADHPVVLAGAKIVEPILGPVDEVGTWKFATDGGHFSQAGMACLGFGPGDELLAHTVNERIPIDALEVALDVNEALAREMGAALAGS
jgi:putative selenium metabolism hydrolase